MTSKPIVCNDQILKYKQHRHSTNKICFEKLTKFLNYFIIDRAVNFIFLKAITKRNEICTHKILYLLYFQTKSQYYIIGI